MKAGVSRLTMNALAGMIAARDAVRRDAWRSMRKAAVAAAALRPPPGTRRCAGGSDWHVGVGRDRGLAVAHAHAGQGRHDERAAEWRGHSRSPTRGSRRWTAAARRTVSAASCGCRTRLKISWQDDLTLKIETDAGQQTRLLQFPKPGAAALRSAARAPARTLQGTSVAEWQRSGGAFDAFLERGAGAAPPRWGALKVTTTNMSSRLAAAQWRALQPERDRSPSTSRKVTNPQAGEWFVVTTVVDDPTYLGAAVRDELELQERSRTTPSGIRRRAKPS